mmetsp:Transcript_90702/g.234195  ORF Transcript_90702/g.234195 Transcript_90702/m.234195 type:complete len:347 (-) Transcript_90702:1087-2127(-)
MQFLQVLAEQLLDVLQPCVPVWEPIEVTHRAIIWRVAIRALESHRVHRAVPEGVVREVVEVLRSHVRPSLQRCKAAVAEGRVGEATAGRGSWARLPDIVTWFAYVVQDNIDDHADTRSPAPLHHVAEIVYGAGAGIQAEGDGLVLGKPFRTGDVLHDWRHLHGIEAIGSQIVLALSGHVGEVPLPELHEHRAARICAIYASDRLLVITQLAEDFAAAISLGGGGGKERSARGALPELTLPHRVHERVKAGRPQTLQAYGFSARLLSKRVQFKLIALQRAVESAASTWLQRRGEAVPQSSEGLRWSTVAASQRRLAHADLARSAAKLQVDTTVEGLVLVEDEAEAAR